jgi:MFS family permease
MVLLGYGSINNVQILASFTLYGLGSSFVSGALSSLMFGNARGEDGETFNSNRYFSATEKVAVASFIVASASVGFISEWFGRGSFLIASFFFLFAAIFVTLALPEPKIERHHRNLGKEFVTKITDGISGIRKSAQLMVLLPVRMLHQIETILGILWLPWIRDLGGGDARWFSLLATGSYILRYIVNHYFTNKSRPNSYMPRIAFSLACMALGSIICIFANNVWIAFFGVWTMAGARGAFLPAVQAVQHEEFDEKIRTTGLSFMNFSTEMMVAASYFISSMVVDNISIQLAWGISAGAFVVASILGKYVDMKSRIRG